MAKIFDITLTAKDKFSAVFNRLNKDAATTTRATKESGKTADMAGRSTEKWARGMERLTRAATSGVGALRDVAEPLSALGAVRFGGAAGAVVALAASVGILTQKWAESTVEVGRTSKAFGVDATDLQTWAAAANAAGFNADEMADSYTKLARILYLAKNAPGMVPNEIGVLSKYKIDIDDPKKAMRQVAELLGKTPVGPLRSGIGEALGQNESSIRFMSIGIEKITDLLEKLQRAGQAQSKDALDQAEAQVSALGRLENAWTRVKNAIGVKVSPVMEWVADAVTGESPKGGRSPAATAGGQSASEGMDYFLRGAGIAGEMYKPAVPTSGPPLAQGSSELARMLQDDLRNGAQFNSPATMNKVLGENPAIQLEVTFVNAPPDTSIRARAGGQQVPVRISNTSPSGSTP